MFALREIFLYFLLPILTFAYFFMKRKFSYFERKEIPHVRPAVTNLMGNLSGVGTTVHFFNLIREFYEKFKREDSIFGFYSAWRPCYVLCSEEAVKAVMIKDFNSFVNRGIYFNEDEPLTGGKKRLKINLED